MKSWKPLPRNCHKKYKNKFIEDFPQEYPKKIWNSKTQGTYVAEVEFKKMVGKK